MLLPPSLPNSPALPTLANARNPVLDLRNDPSPKLSQARAILGTSYGCDAAALFAQAVAVPQQQQPQAQLQPQVGAAPVPQAANPNPKPNANANVYGGAIALLQKFGMQGYAGYAAPASSPNGNANGRSYGPGPAASASSSRSNDIASNASGSRSNGAEATSASTGGAPQPQFTDQQQQQQGMIGLYAAAELLGKRHDSYTGAYGHPHAGLALPHPSVAYVPGFFPVPPALQQPVGHGHSANGKMTGSGSRMRGGYQMSLVSSRIMFWSPYHFTFSG
ncbi:hypothetical protein B0H19DRAFT_1260710 [Mycena capillaripes]|nr:hypothetical protein B0H19DRAFT_1260710 [Mycena capillaripes]